MVQALLFLGLLVAAFLVLIVRPQRRQMAAHRALVASLHVKTTASRNAVSALARAGRGQGIVQLGALCAGGK